VALSQAAKGEVPYRVNVQGDNHPQAWEVEGELVQPVHNGDGVQCDDLRQGEKHTHVGRARDINQSRLLERF
jgi:hypothetical protein